MSDPFLRVRLRRVNLNREQLMAEDGPVYQATKRAAEKAVEYAKEAAPVRSGDMRDAIEYRIYKTPTRIVADIGLNSEEEQKKALWTNFGTGRIFPVKPGGLLVIADGRGPVTRHKSVAGQQANPWLTRAVERVRRGDFEQGG